MAYKKVKKSKKNSVFDLLPRRRVALLVTTLLAIYVLLPKLSSFKDSFNTIASADLAYICLAVVFVAVTYLAAAASYYFIAYFKLKYWRTVLVQVADGFTNRLLPAGAGGLATNALYLIKQGHNKTKAGYVAGLDNLIGFVGHIALLIVLLIFNSVPVSSLFTVHVSSRSLGVAAIVILLVLVVFIAVRQLRRVTSHAVVSIGEVTAYALRHPAKFFLALTSSVAVTASYSLALYACCLALNVHLSVLQVFFVLSAGVVSSVITPTPGGVGGVEAGLVAALVAVGVDAHQALSVALVYRMLTYWLPILPGLVAFKFVLNRKYIKAV